MIKQTLAHCLLRVSDEQLQAAWRAWAAWPEHAQTFDGFGQICRAIIPPTDVVYRDLAEHFYRIKYNR